MKFSENYKINAHDCDMNNTVSASAILRYMLDTANCHMEHDGPAYDELFDSGYSFVLSRMSVVFHKPLHVHDKIIGETWACTGRGVTFPRCFRLIKDGDVIAEGTSVWALIKLSDRTLVKCDEIPLNYSVDGMLTLELPSRLRLPNGLDLAEVGNYRAGYRDVDRNLHINNTNYADILFGFLPDMKNKRVASMMINFLAEAPLGGDLTVFHSECDGLDYFRTVRSDGSVNVECAMRIESIN